MVCLTLTGYTQKQKFSFGMFAGYEFSSAYFEKLDNIPSNEKIKTNYRFGLIMGRLVDTSLINFNVGIYYQYRSFSVNISVDELDPNYINYLTKINPEYHIIGLPLSVDWKLFSKNNYFIRAKTGLCFEISIYRKEYSEYNNGVISKSRRLIADDDWRTGIPLVLGIGADVDLSKNFRFGFYPSINFYLKKFNGAAESGYSSTFGVNLYLLLK